MTPTETDAFLAGPVVVEEKLDGANMTVGFDPDDAVRSATRGGVSAMDSAGQRGPLRAWVAERADALRTLLAGGWVLYGEWLWLTPGVRYERLPEWLIGLDLWHEDSGWAQLDERDKRMASAGIPSPARLPERRRLRRADDARALIGRSAYGPASADGVVLRRVEASSPRLAKVVAEQYERRDDAQWRRRERNRLAA